MSDFEKHRNAGSGYLANDNYLKAIDSFIKAYNLKNKDDELLENLAFCYYSIRDYSNAIIFYEKINFEDVKDISRKLELLYYLGISYAIRLNDEKALWCYNQINKFGLDIDGPDPDNILSMLAIANVKIKNFKNASVHYLKLTANLPNDTAKMIEYGKCLLGEGKIDESLKVHLKLYKNLPKDSKDKIKNILCLINIYYNLKGNYTESIKYIDAYLTIDPNCHDQILLRSICLSKNGKFEEGEKLLLDDYNRVKSNVSNNSSIVTASAPNIFTTLVNFYISTENFDQCQDVIKECKRLFPKDYKFYELELDLSFAQENYKEGKEIIVKTEKSLSKDPFYVRGKFCKYLANKFIDKQMYDDAIYCIDELIKIEKCDNNNSDESLMYKGNLLFQKGDYEASIKIYTNSIINKTGKVFYMVALNYQKLKNIKDSISFLDKAMLLFPNYITPYFSKITILIQEKQYDNALKLIDETDKVIPMADEEEMQRAIMYTKLDDLRKLRVKCQEIDKGLKKMEEDDEKNGGVNSQNISYYRRMVTNKLDQKEGIFVDGQVLKNIEEFMKAQREINEKTNDKFKAIDMKFEKYQLNVEAIVNEKLEAFNTKIDVQVKNLIENNVKEVFSKMRGSSEDPDTKVILQLLTERLKNLEKEIKVHDTFIEELLDNLDKMMENDGK